jgi:hypothetical protein
MASVFTVTRQLRWPDGLNIVEISQGGIEYTNPDMLIPRYPGEGDEYEGLTAAVEAAIEVAKAWKQETDNEVFIAVGCTYGMTAQFDAEPATEETFRYLLKEAAAFDKRQRH